MNEQPKIHIRLYGVLREKFGKDFIFVGRTPADAIRALCTMKPGFRQHLEEFSEPGYQVLDGTQELDAEDLLKPTPRLVKLIPGVAAGSGAVKLVVGVVLIAVGFYLSAIGFAPIGGFLIKAGTALAIGGVAEMLAKPPSYAPAGIDKGPADTPTYAFSGPHMTTGQGNCVPLGYGRVRISGALISLGISAETWTTNGLGGSAPDEVGTIGGDGDTTPWSAALAPA